MSDELIDRLAFQMYKLENPTEADGIITRQDTGIFVAVLKDVARAMEALGCVVVKRA